MRGHRNDGTFVQPAWHGSRSLRIVQTCPRQPYEQHSFSSRDLFRPSLQQCFRAGAEPLRSRIRALGFAGIDQYSRSSNRGCCAFSPIPRCAKYQIYLAVRPADLHSPHLVLFRLPATRGLGCRVPLRFRSASRLKPSPVFVPSDSYLGLRYLRQPGAPRWAVHFFETAFRRNDAQRRDEFRAAPFD
jgi:hypothetical protein